MAVKDRLMKNHCCIQIIPELLVKTKLLKIHVLHFEKEQYWSQIWKN